MVSESLKDELSLLFRVYKTVVKMLRKRKYLITEDAGASTYEEFLEKYSESTVPSASGDDSVVNRETLTLLASALDDPNDRIFVFFPQDPKVGIKPIRVYSERMKSQTVRRAILVVQENLTPFAKTAISELSNDPDGKYLVEYFNQNELLIDITEHELVPKHEVLTPEEKDQLLKRYKLEETQLPRMQTGDPIARYFGLQIGDVVKIIRPSETAGRYVTYRIVL